MYIIKLDAIDSTNSYLREISNRTIPKDYTVVWSEYQTNGRGQMGTNWQSESGKNLTFSIFKKNVNVELEDQFTISMIVSLGIIHALKKFQLPKLAIKWPNDILSEEQKICGILIENIIKNNRLVGSIIGVGINVNQRFFKNLPTASSMYLLTGKLYTIDEVLTEVTKTIQYYFQSHENGSKTIDLTKAYHSALFRMGKPSTFRLNNGETFVGIIKGVDELGKLKIWLQDDEIQTFDFKQISLLY